MYTPQSSINRTFITRYKEHIFQIRLKNFFPNSNITNTVLKNTHTVNLDTNKYLEIMDRQKTFYIGCVVYL